jgi:hypothetical protein
VNDSLAYKSETLSTCDQHTDAWALAHKGIDYRRYWIEHVLTVVKDEKDIAITQFDDETVGCKSARLLARRHYRGDRLRDKLRIAQRLQLDQPDTGAVFSD